MISVIVPIYNVEKYLYKCLSSIKNQIIDSEFEVLLIDDGSTDSSSIIAKSFVEIDKRFKYYKKKNGGLSSARNYGVNLSSGEYICFVDSDDYIHPLFLNLLFGDIKRYNSDVAICSYKIINSDDANIQVIKKKKSVILNNYDAIKLILEKDEYGNYAWNKMFRKNIFHEFPNGKYFEDIFTTYKILKNASRISVMNHKLYYYRRRENSILSTMNHKKIIDYIDAINIRYSDLIKYDKIRKTLNINLIKSYIYAFIQLNKIKDDIDVNQIDRCVCVLKKEIFLKYIWYLSFKEIVIWFFIKINENIAKKIIRRK